MRKTQIFMNKPVYLGLSVLELSKIVTYEFSYKLYVSLHTQKQMIFIKTLQMMLNQGLILQIMNLTHHYEKVKIKK